MEKITPQNPTTTDFQMDFYDDVQIEELSSLDFVEEDSDSFFFDEDEDDDSNFRRLFNSNYDY